MPRYRIQHYPDYGNHGRFNPQVKRWYGWVDLEGDYVLESIEDAENLIIVHKKINSKQNVNIITSPH